MKISLTAFYVLLVSLTLAQIPDYSELSNDEKLSLLNEYGYVVLTSNDTVFGKVLFDRQSNYPILDKDGNLEVRYPKKLSNYPYLEKIPASKVKLFYFGSPRELIHIDFFEGSYILTSKVENGTFDLSIWYRVSDDRSPYLAYNPNSGFTDFAGGGSPIVETLLITDSGGKKIAMMGSAKEKKQILQSFFSEYLNEKEVKRIKTSNYEVTELVKRLNVKFK